MTGLNKANSAATPNLSEEILTLLHQQYFDVLGTFGKGETLKPMKGSPMTITLPVHPFPSSKDIINQISSDPRVFIKLDGLKSYFQIPMEENSSYLTTILLLTRKYRYKRAPMGLSSSTDKWNMRSDAAVAGLEGVAKEVDDILIQAPDYPTLWNRLRNTMDRCCEHGIMISKQKIEMGDTI